MLTYFSLKLYFTIWQKLEFYFLFNKCKAFLWELSRRITIAVFNSKPKDDYHYWYSMFP